MILMIITQYDRETQCLKFQHLVKNHVVNTPEINL